MFIKNGFQELNKEFDKEYFLKLQKKLILLYDEIYPPKKDIFKVFELCSLKDIKVVILGQDPYHQPSKANGLCFSVNKRQSHPRSLTNILKEVSRDCNCKYPNSGDLTPWALQGVFLLNTILTVSANKPASHRNMGWETFTNKVIEIISEENDNVVFMLWGKYAQSKMSLISTNKHLVLTASHPSPFSARLSFNGCSHFSKANTYLKETGQTTINWCLN